MRELLKKENWMIIAAVGVFVIISMVLSTTMSTEGILRLVASSIFISISIWSIIAIKNIIKKW